MSGTNIIEKVILPTFVVTATFGVYSNDLNNNISVDSFHSNNPVAKLFSERQPSYDKYTDMRTAQHLEKINTISNFANNLLSNSIDLKKEISEMVDEDFWDLI